MDSIAQNMTQGMQEAMAIWLSLLAAVVITFALLSALSRGGDRKVGWWTRLTRAVRDPENAKNRRLRAERRVAEFEELQRYLAEVSVASERASVMAERRRVEWQAAQRTQDAAWRAFEEAEKAVVRLQKADAFPRVGDDEEDLVARRRHLVRMVNAAHERGEISATQLADALMHRNGWDPTKHPFQQQMMLRRVIRDRLFEAYQEATELERAAAHASDVAAAAKRSLDEEVFAAELKVRRAAPPRPAERRRFAAAAERAVASRS